jgi:hypothetical protein
MAQQNLRLIELHQKAMLHQSHFRFTLLFIRDPVLTANKDQDCYTAQMSAGCRISIASIAYHHIATTHMASRFQKSSMIRIRVLR